MNTLYTMTLGTSVGGPGYTRRHIIAASALLADANQVRVLFHATATAYTITDAYIGLQATSGDAYDIDPATMLRLTQADNTTLTIKTGTEYSDTVSLQIDGSRAVVISLYGATSQVYLAGTLPAGYSAYHKSGNDAAVADSSGYTLTTSNVIGFRGIEGDMGATVVSALVGEYGDIPSILTALTGLYSAIMEAAIIGRYTDAPVLQSVFVGRYSDAPLVQSALVGRYGDMVQVAAALDIRYHLMHARAAALVGSYAICGAAPIAGLVGRYDLRERDEILAALEGYYSLFPGATMERIICPVLIGGVAVKWSDLSWTISEDSYLIEATITLRDHAQWRSIAKQDTVVITWQGTTYTLFVATKLRGRSISGTVGAAEYGADYVVVARSLTAGLDAPYALPITLEWNVATMASQIAADLIGLMRDIIPLDFQLEDWLQPGRTFFVTDQTPLDGLRALAGLVGGIVQTGPENSLVLRKADPIAHKNWATAAPAWTIEDSGIFSDSETEEISSLYNVITVTNQADTAETVRFELEEVSDYRKRIKGYRTPWVDFGLATSGGDWVTIEDEGVIEEQITEMVEFVDGAASASKSIYSQVSVSWRQVSLGAVTGAEDGSLTAAVAGCSLAEITYTTRYHSWIGASSQDETVQFYQVDL